MSWIDKIVSTIGDQKAIAVCNLKNVLKNAILIEKQDDTKERNNILNILLFKLDVHIEDSGYELWIYIRQYTFGYYLYSLNINHKKTIWS